MKLSSTVLFLTAALNAFVAAPGTAKSVRQLAAVTGKTGVTFADDSRHLPYNLLMGLERHREGDTGSPDADAGGDSEDHVYVEPGFVASPSFAGRPCSMDEMPDESMGTRYDVVLAISECVDQPMMDTIESWVTAIKSSAPDFITFSTTMVPGSCQSVSESTKRGVNDEPVDATSPDVLLAHDKAASNMARLQQFAQFGRVLQEINDFRGADVVPTTLISFVTDEKSFTEVQGFEYALQFGHTFNFQICRKGGKCEGRFETCAQIADEVDLFAYNPFSVTRHFGCDGILQGGLPIRFVTENNERGCYCACPAGHKETNGQCVAVDPPANQCPWTKVDGFRKEICHAEDACEFKAIASEWKVPVPFPTDGYVADDRDNIDTGKNPRVDVIVTKRADPVYKLRDIDSRVGQGVWPKKIAEVPRQSGLFPVVVGGSTDSATYSYEWKDYQKHGVGYIDDLKFTAFGKYEVTVDAFDYMGEAQCPGCLAIVDSVRPHHTTECPNSFFDEAIVGFMPHDSGAELTVDNLQKAQDLITNFYKFGEEATNDNCEQSRRCDKKEFKLDNFFDEHHARGGYGSDDYEDGKTCFDTEEVLGDFINSKQAKVNPLIGHDGRCLHHDDNPVKPNQCSRCCSLQAELKELWTDYKCGYDYDTHVCSGDLGEKCSVKQCLVLNGDSVAIATAAIKDTVVEESATVLQNIGQKSFNTITQIHRALKCTAFDKDKPECTYQAKLSDLINADAEFKLDFGEGANVDDFVFWRYQVRGEQWEVWKYPFVTEDVINFVRPETMITIEAWTQCGKVRTFYFYVHLHLDSPILVCDYFSQMWYQSTVSLLKADNKICAYPGSDFAELTFDYHANIGLQYSRDRTHMSISHVTCTGSLDDRKTTTILDIDHDNAEIVKRFGIELVNRDTTLPTTKFAVECTFTYKDLNGNEVAQQPCKRQFSVEDCEPPTFDDEENCEWTGCAGNKKPGLYEACGGNIIRAKPGKTYIDSVDSKCCQGCKNGQSVACVSLLNLPNQKEDLKRCEPVEDQEFDNYDDGEGHHHGHRNHIQHGAMLEAATSTMEQHPGATALIAASALIALVALVVVNHRAKAARKEQAQDDAYYPLLY